MLTVELQKNLQETDENMPLTKKLWHKNSGLFFIFYRISLVYKKMPFLLSFHIQFYCCLILWIGLYFHIFSWF